MEPKALLSRQPSPQRKRTYKKEHYLYAYITEIYHRLITQL